MSCYCRFTLILKESQIDTNLLELHVTKNTCESTVYQLFLSISFKTLIELLSFVYIHFVFVEEKSNQYSFLINVTKNTDASLDVISNVLVSLLTMLLDTL